MRHQAFFDYARERQGIFERRKSGQPFPWTEDSILRSFKFCNVYREDDRVTRWYAKNLRLKELSPGDNLRCTVVFRFLNRIPSGEAIKHLLMPGKWDMEEFERILRARVKDNIRILGSAYMIRTPLGTDKVSGLKAVLGNIMPKVDELAQKMMEYNTLEIASALLQRYHFVGSFMAYEMVSDLRHTPVLREATDKMTWAHAGPGAARGVARILHDKGYISYIPDEKECLQVMQELLTLSKTEWPDNYAPWEMREVEHNLCEFDKYERTRLGDGTPKLRFAPNPEPLP